MWTPFARCLKCPQALCRSRFKQNLAGAASNVGFPHKTFVTLWRNGISRYGPVLPARQSHKWEILTCARGADQCAEITH